VNEEGLINNSNSSRSNLKIRDLRGVFDSASITMNNINSIEGSGAGLIS
jgi:hypothetical protein